MQYYTSRPQSDGQKDFYTIFDFLCFSRICISGGVRCVLADFRREVFFEFLCAMASKVRKTPKSLVGAKRPLSATEPSDEGKDDDKIDGFFSQEVVLELIGLMEQRVQANKNVKSVSEAGWQSIQKALAEAKPEFAASWQ